jgi:uncharacterized iron-regulated membrane protein
MVFMLMLCLTGLPSIFHHELNGVLGYEPEVPAMPARTAHVSLDEVVTSARALKPGLVVQYLVFDHEKPDVAFVNLARDVRSAPSDMAILSLDRRNAAPLREPRPNEGPVGFLLQLHVDMFLSLGGKLFLGAMGFLFVMALVLYGPFMRKLDFGTVRRTRTRRIQWLDWHNLVGVATVCWALIVGGTGVVNTWADLMLKVWQFGQLAEMTALYRDSPRPVRLASIAEAVATAKAAAPNMSPRFVACPGTVVSSNDHYALFMAGDTPLTSRLLNPALIDAVTGELTDMRAMPWYIQALLVSQPPNFGGYGGLPLKIVWALLDLATIVVLSSGLYLCIARRRSKRAGDRVKTGAGLSRAGAAE